MKVAGAQLHQDDQTERFSIDGMIPELNDAGFSRQQTHTLNLLDERFQLLFVARTLKLQAVKDPTSFEKTVRIRGEMVVHVRAFCGCSIHRGPGIPVLT